MELSYGIHSAPPGGRESPRRPPLHGLLGPALLAAGLATLDLSRQVGTRLWKILSGLERLDLGLSHDVEQIRG